MLAWSVECFVIGVKVSGAGMGNSLAGLTYYATNEDDPYITLNENVRSCFATFIVHFIVSYCNC